MDHKIILNYTNSLRKDLLGYLKDNFNISFHIYNCGVEGAVLILFFKEYSMVKDELFDNYNSIGAVLQNIDQNFVQGNYASMKFSGTNMMMDPQRIIIIKDSSEKEWGKNKLQEDLNFILHTSKK